MEKPRLILEDETQFELTGALTSLGRTPDNDVSFPEDSNVSRYHAEIEERGAGEYWLIDLQSSNGTKLNGEPVTAEKPLSDGDQIELGGSSLFTFITREPEPETDEEEETDEEDSEESDDKAADEPEEEAPKSKTFKYLLIAAAVVLGFALILCGVALYFYFSGDEASNNCVAKAEIISPENGDILSESTNVEIDVDDDSCVSEASFKIDGKEFARADIGSLTATLDPAKFPEFSDGYDRKLTVSLLDEDGKEIPQSNEIAIALETIETEPPEPTATPGTVGPGGTDRPPPTKTTSLIDTQQMAKNVLPGFSGGVKHNASNPRFLADVSKTIPEYASEGYFERASKYRDVINSQFILQNVDLPLGYILAMSRTKFVPARLATGAGLWNMNNKLVLDNNYNGICGAETIASETQRCASIAAASYLKDLVLNVFNGDVVYGVAAFGMDKQDAAAWNASLPADPNTRADFWNVIKDTKRREQVVRFFAASIVLQNPKKFGLQKDKPIAELYPAYAE
jgi:pSer/pThr/pTyr-binding forkhead associated (FHA) protein